MGRAESRRTTPSRKGQAAQERNAMVRLLILAVDQAGGTLTISPEAQKAMAPTTQLTKTTDPDGTIRLALTKPGAAAPAKAAVERADAELEADRALGRELPATLAKYLGATHFPDTVETANLIDLWEELEAKAAAGKPPPKVGIVGPVPLGSLVRHMAHLDQEEREAMGPVIDPDAWAAARRATGPGKGA